MKILDRSFSSELCGEIADRWNDQYKEPSNLLALAESLDLIFRVTPIALIEGVVRAIFALIAFCAFQGDAAVSLIVSSGKSFLQPLYAGWMVMRMWRGQDLIHPDSTPKNLTASHVNSQELDLKHA